jgi:PRA1 family protein 1
MHNSKATAAGQSPQPAASTPMYGTPASSAGSGAGGYVYPAPTNSGAGGYAKIPNYTAPTSSGTGGYAKIPNYPTPPSSYPSALPPQSAAQRQQGPIHDPTAPPSPLAKAAELVTRFREQGQALIAARRPWAEVFRAPAFNKPLSIGEALSRVRRNAAYFRANYLLAVFAVVAASLLWHPATLFVLLALCAAWFFLYFARPAQGGQPLRVFGTEFDDGTVLAALCGVTVIAMLFTNVGWNVIGSVLIGGVLVGVHGALRTTDDLFLTEQEAAGDGLVAASITAAGPILPTYARIG